METERGKIVKQIQNQNQIVSAVLLPKTLKVKLFEICKKIKHLFLLIVFSVIPKPLLSFTQSGKHRNKHTNRETDIKQDIKIKRKTFAAKNYFFFSLRIL